MENLSGTIIKGYKLEERIGAGGFGAVYKARQSTVQRDVAIKIILPGFANKPDFIRRFEQEAQIIARLEHLHITPLYDYWRDRQGAYLVMRLLRGGSLRDQLNEGNYGLDATVHLIDQIASALSTAHQNGVIHRDLKPENILLDEDGNAYLGDFGIAKNLQIPAEENLTSPDAVVGSLDYISPEQARGEAVTPRTDVYSLGVVTYEMITGKHPFDGFSSIERFYKHINDPLPEITNLEGHLLAEVNLVIQQATAKDPMNRYEDVFAFASGLRKSVQKEVDIATLTLEEILTKREHEILQYLIDGRSNREIAEALFIEVDTVKWNNKNIFRKLGVRSRVQAAVKARDLNLIGGADNGSASQVLTHLSSYLTEPDNPYKGLHAFQIGDADDFYGRDKLIQKLLTRLSTQQANDKLLAIVGPSGSGKSSLVRAGLIPALRSGKIEKSDRWFIVDMIPSTHPLDKLEVALTRVAADQAVNLHEHLQRDSRGLIRIADLILPNDGSELVIVIDQFEELFTLVADEARRQHFLDLIHTATTDPHSRVRVIVTLRADFYDRPLHYPKFGELFRESMETILPLTAEELTQAISAPAKRVMVTFEEGLITKIVADVNYQSGALPLLQYALTELFERRQGHILTHQAYSDIGGAVGALARRADELYTEANEIGQHAIHELFLRLVTLGEGTEDTRRRVLRDELLALVDAPDLMDEVIDTFAEYRLLELDHDPATRKPTVEVAHEAILGQWERLRQWLNSSREDIRQQRQVTQWTQEWHTAKNDPSYLLRGNRLEQINQWRETTLLSLTSRESAFLKASMDAHQTARQLEAERQAREAQLESRSRNILRTLVAVFALATILSGGLGIFAFVQRNDAVNARDDAEIAEQQALSQAGILLAASAQDELEDGFTDRAILLALEALENYPYSAQAERALGEALTYNRVLQQYLGHNRAVVSADWSPDGM